MTRDTAMGAITNNIPMQAALKLKPKHVVVMASDNLENSTELGVRIAAPFFESNEQALQNA